ncbi:MAG: ATP-binding cassette domain-containing protein, partial [bacterium]
MIRVQNLHRSFDSQRVLRGVDLDIPHGKTTVVIGRSGIGKSVFLKHLIGLMKPDEGRIWIEGEEITGLSKDEMDRVRRKFGMLFQGAALFDSMNVFDNVAFPLRERLRLSRGEIEERVREKLRLVGLNGAEHKMPAELSGGMRKRVGLARAIALAPPIILYDEPTTGLDPILCD